MKNLNIKTVVYTMSLSKKLCTKNIFVEVKLILLKL